MRVPLVTLASEALLRSKNLQGGQLFVRALHWRLAMCAV